MSALRFKKDDPPPYGEAIVVEQGILKITAPNPGPFTYHGTNSYLIGNDNLAIIDPGPDDDDHFEALMRTIGDRKLSHIFVSHTHKDHSPLAKRLKSKTGAQIFAEGPHRAARELNLGEINPLKESSDLEFKPDIQLNDGDVIDGGDWQIEAVHTPGHTANHCAFGLVNRDILFSADHIMAWSTTIVAPPDGAMSDFMSSLGKLITREDKLMLPGHGGAVDNPKRFLPALKHHRLSRESQIVDQLSVGESQTISDIVAKIYVGLDTQLLPAASLSTLAHLEDLVTRGDVKADGPPSLTTHFYI